MEQESNQNGLELQEENSTLETKLENVEEKNDNIEQQPSSQSESESSSSESTSDEEGEGLSPIPPLNTEPDQPSENAEPAIETLQPSKTIFSVEPLFYLSDDQKKALYAVETSEKPITLETMVKILKICSS
jgi:hypothetical protein